MGAHFGFAKLVVTDLDAAAAFYIEVFAVEEHYRVHAEIAGRAIDEILFKATAPGAATFALLQFADQGSASHGEVILGFITTDVDTLFARAVKAGGLVAQAVESQPEHGVRVGFLRDPEGHLIEVVELLTAG
jgi:predicted enzyme related to lactoylglutathione lyase